MAAGYRTDRRLAGEIGALLARSRRGVWRNASRRMEAAGESLYTWRLLAYLAQEGPAVQGDLALATAQHPASISRILDALERDGSVRRRRDPRDRRRIYVELAAPGRKRFLAHADDAVAAVAEALSPLSEDEQKTLRDLLAKVVDGAQDGAATAGTQPAAPATRRRAARLAR